MPGGRARGKHVLARGWQRYTVLHTALQLPALRCVIQPTVVHGPASAWHSAPAHTVHCGTGPPWLCRMVRLELAVCARARLPLVKIYRQPTAFVPTSLRTGPGQCCGVCALSACRRWWRSQGQKAMMVTREQVLRLTWCCVGRLERVKLGWGSLRLSAKQ